MEADFPISYPVQKNDSPISTIEYSPFLSRNLTMKAARLLITLILAAGIVGFVVWRSSRTEVVREKLIGFQGADEPFTMPERGTPDMRFHFLSAWQANQVPTAGCMDVPMGSENGALIYNAQKFWEMNEKRGGYHTGDDLNGIGGMNTDLGDPVFAAGDGLVIFTGEPSTGWGNIVVLAHRDSKGKPVHTMYAHLHEIKITLNTLVARGEVIGTVGTANGNYPAHLHFEARASDGADIGGGYTAQPLNRLDPVAIVTSLHDASEKGVCPAPLAFAKQDDASWTKLEIKNAEIFSELKE